MATLQHRPAVFDHVSSDDDTQHSQRPPPAIPPSPTLSNPDLILPENDGERESQTPSPPFNLPSLSHLQAFYGNGGTVSMQGGYASGYTNGSDGKDHNKPDNPTMAPIGVAYSLTNSSNRAPKKNLFPRHAHSAHRLSDIGEEEGPLTPPRRSSSRLGRFPVNAPPAGQDRRGPTSSPALRNQTAGENGNHNIDSKGASSRSSSSNSTISGNGEPSQQQSENQKGNMLSGKGNMLHMGVNDNPNNNASERGRSGDELSSAILSNEAERILDNAKKRLTVCISLNS